MHILYRCLSSVFTWVCIQGLISWGGIEPGITLLPEEYYFGACLLLLQRRYPLGFGWKEPGILSEQVEHVGLSNVAMFAWKFYILALNGTLLNQWELWLHRVLFSAPCTVTIQSQFPPQGFQLNCFRNNGRQCNLLCLEETYLLVFWLATARNFATVTFPSCSSVWETKPSQSSLLSRRWLP